MARVEAIADNSTDSGSFWSAWSIIRLLIKRELKVKYRGTFLGYLWSMLNPLLTMTVIVIVFSHLVRGIENYSIYVLSGLLLWNVGMVSMQTGAMSIVGASPLIRKVRVSIWAFPMVSVGSAVVNMFFSFGPYLILYAFLANEMPTYWYLFPVVVGLFFIFVIGLTLIVSVANVFFRDVAHVLEPVLQLVFYATPIIYTRDHEMIPEKVAYVLGFNPFTQFVEGFRATAFPGADITGEKLMLLTTLSLSSLAVGMVVYRWNRPRIKFAL